MLNKIFYKTYNPLSGVEVEGGLCSPAGRVADGRSWSPGGFGFCLPFEAKVDRLSSSKRRFSGRNPGTQEAAGNSTGTVGSDARTRPRRFLGSALVLDSK